MSNDSKGGSNTESHQLNPRQYKFYDYQKVKIWRCPNRLFTFKNDSDTLAVTVAMCTSVCRNRWDDGGIKRRERKREKERLEAQAAREAITESGETTGENPGEPGDGTAVAGADGTLNLLDEINKEIKTAKKDSAVANENVVAERKETKHTNIQDHPCLYYTRRTTNKKVTQAERKGMAATHICNICEDIYQSDTRDWIKMGFKGSTKYYESNGHFTRNAKLIRMISCCFQGLRKLTIQKPLGNDDSFQRAFDEGRTLKPASFTNMKVAPEWYYRLFIPCDAFDEVIMTPACAKHILGLLWPDIREMLLTEIDFDEKYIKVNASEQIARLKVRFGKNNIKRVIPGVREICDECMTSLFNSHFICIYCGSTICPMCGEQEFEVREMDNTEKIVKKNTVCQLCYDNQKFDKEAYRASMLPIAFIPMDAITHMLHLLEYLMKKNENYGIPDSTHPLSLEKYFKEKGLIPESVKWSQLNRDQQQQLMERDNQKREQRREEQITSVLDELYAADLSDYEDNDDETKLSPSGNNNIKIEPPVEEIKKTKPKTPPPPAPKPACQQRRIEATGEIEFRAATRVRVNSNHHFRQTEGSTVYVDGKRHQAWVYLLTFTATRQFFTKTSSRAYYGTVDNTVSPSHFRDLFVVPF